ncbi:hypothetical protein [Novacetimonas pomaceti]|uniref:hypothetical protein n=1 Tax=Novacetimonas pomaceti TaxID=2021998 RepID=UPI0010580556|nr:hypothetical protein [Novacetimonas pomaceti]
MISGDCQADFFKQSLGPGTLPDLEPAEHDFDAIAAFGIRACHSDGFVRDFRPGPQGLIPFSCQTHPLTSRHHAFGQPASVVPLYDYPAGQLLTI